VQGSLYKLICRELLLFLVVYILLGVIYRQLMSPAQKEYAQMDAVKRFFSVLLFNLIAALGYLIASTFFRITE
jgi:hypothetical protein